MNGFLFRFFCCFTRKFFFLPANFEFTRKCFFSWNEDSSCESSSPLHILSWKLFSYFLIPTHSSLHPPPHNRERLFMAVKTSFYSIHVFSIHFLFPLDMCTHFPHIFHSASLFELFLIVVLLPTIKFRAVVSSIYAFILMLFVYLLRVFALCWGSWKEKLFDFSFFFRYWISNFSFFFFHSSFSCRLNFFISTDETWVDLARHQECRRHAKEASSHSHGHREAIRR